jgi:hypothetical protein
MKTAVILAMRNIQESKRPLQRRQFPLRHAAGNNISKDIKPLIVSDHKGDSKAVDVRFILNNG